MGARRTRAPQRRCLVITLLLLPGAACESAASMVCHVPHDDIGRHLRLGHGDVRHCARATIFPRAVVCGRRLSGRRGFLHGPSRPDEQGVDAQFRSSVDSAQLGSSFFGLRGDHLGSFRLRAWVTIGLAYSGTRVRCIPGTRVRCRNFMI